MEQEYGRIKKSDRKEVVIRYDEYNGKKGVTIREFLHGKKYQGFIKNGTRIPIEKWNEFKNIINSINHV